MNEILRTMNEILIGYPCGQDGTVLPALDCLLYPAEKNGVHFMPCNKSSIGQACSVKMAEYWPHSFAVFMDLDSILVHNHAKKELDQYPAILTSC